MEREYSRDADVTLAWNGVLVNADAIVYVGVHVHGYANGQMTTWTGRSRLRKQNKNKGI